MLIARGQRKFFFALDPQGEAIGWDVLGFRLGLDALCFVKVRQPGFFPCSHQSTEGWHDAISIVSEGCKEEETVAGICSSVVWCLSRVSRFDHRLIIIGDMRCQPQSMSSGGTTEEHL